MTQHIIPHPMPIVIIVMVFLIPILGIFSGMLATYFNYRKRREMFALYHEERLAAIEKGIELPPLPEEFFRENGGTPRRRSPHRSLLAGLVLVFTGLTLYLALYFTGTRTDEGGDAAPFALIPAGIGAACLIYYFTVGRKVAAAMEEERKAWLAEASRVKNPAA